MIRAALAFLLLTGSALAHSWYSIECCSGHDCAPTEAVTEGPDGYAVQLKTARALIPYGDSRIKVSVDKDFHVCEPYPGHVRCLYVPSRGM